MADIAVAILAAGQSRRFGSQDKLCAQFQGKPLGVHVGDQIAALGDRFDHRWIIVSDRAHHLADQWGSGGWTLLVNPDARSGMGSSVAVAAGAARETGAKALLICLADMPLIPRSHFAEFAHQMGRFAPDDVLVTSDGNRRMPPAAFGAAHFTQLAKLTGDKGARELLSQGRTVLCSPDHLVDIDDAQTLQRLG